MEILREGFKVFSEKKVYLVAFLIWVAPILVYSQNLPSHSTEKINGSIEIDGHLNENEWSQVEPITGFRQFEPDEGAPASQRTEVRVLYGNGNVYVGAVLYDKNPSGIVQALSRRDEYNRADWFLLSIDSYFNKRNAFSFGVNAAGVQLDAHRSSDGGGRRGGPMPDGMDPSWDAVWESAVSVHEKGWTVEIRIPYSMLRFPDSKKQTWGIHFTRRIPRLGEVSEWPLVPRTERSNLIAQFGRLTQIENITPRPNIQVRPYTVARMDSRESVQNPGQAEVNTSMDAGGDIKIGLGPNITLDATINPDFGQVESDPAVLNLTAFETFFDEKRPFFIEGIRIYEFPVGRGDLLYTRRIGAQAPIIGATKLSGRTQNGTSFGVLAATTGQQFDPSRNYGVARVRQKLGAISEAGAILTGFDAPTRSGDGRIQSTSGGMDWDFRFLDNRYSIEGFSTFTHRNWTAPDRNSRTGFAGQLWLQKRRGVLDGFVGVDVFDDQFNPNDIGQLRRNNYIANVARLEYQVNQGKSFGFVRRANVGMFSVQQFSYDERLDLGLDLNLDANFTLMNFQEIRFSIGAERPFGGYDLYETRGLGPWARPASQQIQVDFSTDQRRSWQLSPEASYTWHEDGGRGYNLELRGDWSIGSRLSLSGSLEGEWEDNVTAWVSNESFKYTGNEWMIGTQSRRPDELSSGDYITLQDPELLNNIFSGVSPYGRDTYYVPVFGRRDTRSLDFTLRSDFTFTKGLSLQVYSQLFLAKGRYDNFKIMQNRDELASYPAYPKRSAFSLSSFQSNVVLKWRYRPGSDIYLVWSHGRRMRESLNPLAPYGPSPYGNSMGNRIRETFNIFPNNALMVKVEYTFVY